MKEGAGPLVSGFKSEDFIEWVDKNIEQKLAEGRLRKALDKIVGGFFNWAQRHSIWPLHFGIMCCAIEMAATSDPIYDVERHGIIYRSSPRQVDILLLNGPISHKLVPSVMRLYHQMPDPKWVIAMGECTISGGPYYDSYSIINGAQTILPVDIYIPGCPVRPEALMDGFLKLKEKIKAEKKGTVTTKKRHKVSSTKGQLIDSDTEVKALKKGWATVTKDIEKANAAKEKPVEETAKAPEEKAAETGGGDA